MTNKLPLYKIFYNVGIVHLVFKIVQSLQFLSWNEIPLTINNISYFYIFSTFLYTFTSQIIIKSALSFESTLFVSYCT